MRCLIQQVSASRGALASDLQAGDNYAALRMCGGRGRVCLVVRQASRQESRSVPRQDLGKIGLVGAFALPDLLGTALLRGLAILGRDRIGVDQLLREACPAEQAGCNQADVP